MSQYSKILHVVMLFKLLVSSYVGSVVPINTTARLPGKNWTADLLNTTSEAFSNLSEQLEINVSTCICHLYTLLPNVSWSTGWLGQRDSNFNWFNRQTASNGQKQSKIF